MSNNTHKISLTVATMVGLNAMIGAGIFGLASSLASAVGPAGIITYLIAFITIWFLATSLARMTVLYPQSGSFYSYTVIWGGEKLALLAAASYFIGPLIAMSLLCKKAGVYLHLVLPYYAPFSLGISALLCLIIANICGQALSTVGQYILLGSTIFPIVSTIILCIPHASLDNMIPFMPYGIISVFTATKIAVFGLFGFETITALFNIIQNPEKNISIAIKRALLGVGLFYLLFLLAMFLAIPMHLYTENPDITIPEALKIILPNSTILLPAVTSAIIAALLGTVHSLIWASSELLYSYAKLLPSKHFIRYYCSQKVAVLIVGLVILTSYITIDQADIFFSLTAMTVIFSIMTSIVPLLFLKSEWKSGQNIHTIIGLLLGIVIFGVAVESLIKNVITIIH